MNRQLTDRICDYCCFAPTETSRNNLLQEKIDANKIFITGNRLSDVTFVSYTDRQRRSTGRSAFVGQAGAGDV